MALTEDFTFKLGDSGIVLNTDSFGLPFFDLSSLAGLDSAPYRETRRDHEGADGGFMDAEFERGRDVILNGDVFADGEDMEEYLDSLKANFAPSTSLIPFYIKSPGVVERLLYVKPLGCKYDWDQIRRIGQARVQLKMFAEDPRIYAAQLSTATIPFVAGSTLGLGFSFGFSFGFGGSSGTDGVIVNNEGNRPTPPTFTINGPCETPSIRDDTYGHTMTFNISLAAGETLVIDTQYKTVKLNGSVNRRGTLLIPDWFYLQPGQTFLRYNAITGTGSSVSVSFRSAWR